MKVLPLLVLLVWTAAVSADDPLPGQIVIDPAHPQALMRHGGRHVFVCGPGDPEDFLYLGRRHPDGTRDGDQVARIDKLIEHGGNCLYLQVVRSHGGDAGRDGTQNPFIDSDPAKGLDDDILAQWDEWFSRMDRSEILIYLFLYDDGARIWDTGDRVEAAERQFLETLVRKFSHHRNLIWIVGEESEERYSTARVQAIADVIREADPHDHLIGSHHLSGTEFHAWREGGALNHYAMQFNEAGPVAHAGAIEARQQAAGRYQVIYAESTATPPDPDSLRRHAWSVAMGGLMPMLLGMDVVTTPPESLQQCRHLQRFFEATDFPTLSPHDELKAGAAEYVLADPGRSYIAWSSSATSALGLKRLPAGRAELKWLDCVTGQTETTSSDSPAAGDRTFSRPPGIGMECAVAIAFSAADSAAGFPPPESQGGWPVLTTPEEIRSLGEMDPDQLAGLRDWLLQSDDRDFAALVIRHGRVVLEVERGNSSRTDTGDIKSCAKAICATVLAIASEESQQGRTPRKMQFDDKAFDFLPWAQPLSDPRKASITVKQLLNHTSGICPESTGVSNRGPWEFILGLTGEPEIAQLAFDPGTACGYSTHALYHAALVCENVTGRPYDEFTIEKLLEPIGVEQWDFKHHDGREGIGRHASHSLGMPARDMARIAFCMLHDGRWGDRQVIPKWFIEETAAPTHDVHTQELRFRKNAQTFSHGWELPARLDDCADLPADARAKGGSGGQYMAFVPSLDLVIVRQTGSSGQWQYEEFLRRACAAVLTAPRGE